MDINFFEPEHMPQPRADIKIEMFECEPYPDGRRIRVTLKMTPFSERPNLRITAHNSEQQPLAQADVLEAMTKQISLTLHLRGPLPTEQVTTRAQQYYDDSPPQSTVEQVIQVAI
mgnify:CR=1 FL=1